MKLKAIPATVFGRKTTRRPPKSHGFGFSPFHLFIMITVISVDISIVMVVLFTRAFNIITSEAIHSFL